MTFVISNARELGLKYLDTLKAMSLCKYFPRFLPVCSAVRTDDYYICLNLLR